MRSEAIFDYNLYLRKANELTVKALGSEIEAVGVAMWEAL